MVLIAALLIAASSPDTAMRPPGLALAFTAVIQVDEPGKASQLLVDRAEAMGGYFSRRTQEYLDLRIPARKFDAFVDSLPVLGLIMEKNLETQNLDPQRTELEARIKAKRATLEEHYRTDRARVESRLLSAIARVREGGST